MKIIVAILLALVAGFALSVSLGLMMLPGTPSWTTAAGLIAIIPFAVLFARAHSAALAFRRSLLAFTLIAALTPVAMLGRSVFYAPDELQLMALPSIGLFCLFPLAAFFCLLLYIALRPRGA